MNNSRLRATLPHVIFVVAFLLLWEYVMRRQWLPETFFGTPSGIVTYLWDGFVFTGVVWSEIPIQSI